MPFDSLPVSPVRHAKEIAIVDGMADLLATPERWCQGALGRGATSMCLLGAVHHASGWRLETAAPILTAIRRITGDYTIYHWNDAPGRTHAEVLDLIARLRREFEGT